MDLFADSGEVGFVRSVTARALLMGTPAVTFLFEQNLIGVFLFSSEFAVASQVQVLLLIAK